MDQYGSVAAGAAADWYEELREASTARGGFRARVEPVNLERVNGAARWAVYGGSSQEWFMTGELIVSLDAAKLASRLTGLTDRLVKQAARDTVASNVSRDRGATYSRVPTGAHTCAFCLMLASRGPCMGRRSRLAVTATSTTTSAIVFLLRRGVGMICRRGTTLMPCMRCIGVASSLPSRIP